MDPNITGRNSGEVKWDVKPDVKKIVVLGLTPETLWKCYWNWNGRCNHVPSL